MTTSQDKRSPGRPKTRSDQPSMRDKVLNTASLLFMELGYEPVSINMIAERAGVTKASVYYYFENKAVLFTTSVTEMMSRICSYTLKHIQAHSDMKTRLEQIALSKMSRSHVEFESLMREAMPFLTEEQRQAIRTAENSIHMVLAESFREAMEQGQIAQGNPMILSHAFSALLMIGNREFIGDRPVSGAEMAKEIIGLFWNGISQR
ncbi:TetR/AcrR family transcriptional regulator [Cohnella endophytica]|uniref:TetR/AcrR family transcriptional regulator n=1 Tax=Cohnella endophytica TaxID=2419778 RepID=A0A494XX74_9BACL|nr:TetR/AcrR family transcriptional regulator [Cohnella endophytica]RKP55174.1 TetR/AcrR family transcriptional regulator [Cohnella endophytica]